MGLWLVRWTSHLVNNNHIHLMGLLYLPHTHHRADDRHGYARVLPDGHENDRAHNKNHPPHVRDDDRSALTPS